MHFFTALSFSCSLLIFAGVVLADETDPQFSPLGLRTKPGKPSKRAVPAPLDRRQSSCQGTCTTCFGPTYTNCPDSDYLCYDPNQGPPSEACSRGGGGGGGGGSSSVSPISSAASPETTEIADTCLQKGATCQSCFGAGHISCPSGSFYDCYHPDVVSEAEGCNQGGGSGGGSSTPCESQYGPGSLECGTGYCYNPNDGTSCCGDGSTCVAGTQCTLSGSVYKCSGDGTDTSAGITSGAAATPTRTPSSSTTRTSVGNADSESESPTSRATRTTSTSTSSSSRFSASTISPAAPPLAASAATRLSSLKAAAGIIGAVAALIPGLMVIIGLL